MAGKGMQRGSKAKSIPLKGSTSFTSKRLGASHEDAPPNFGAGGEGGKKMPSFADTKPKMYCADGKHGC